MDSTHLAWSPEIGRSAAAVRRKIVTERDGGGGGYLRKREEMRTSRLLLKTAGLACSDRDSSPEKMARQRAPAEADVGVLLHHNSRNNSERGPKMQER